MSRGTLEVCHLSCYLVSKYKDAISAEKHLPSEVNKEIMVILWKRSLSTKKENEMVSTGNDCFSWVMHPSLPTCFHNELREKNRGSVPSIEVCV